MRFRRFNHLLAAPSAVVVANRCCCGWYSCRSRCCLSIKGPCFDQNESIELLDRIRTLASRSTTLSRRLISAQGRQMWVSITCFDQRLLYKSSILLACRSYYCWLADCILDINQAKLISCREKLLEFPSYDSLSQAEAYSQLVYCCKQGSQFIIVL